jgi:hypothetical protein
MSYYQIIKLANKFALKKIFADNESQFFNQMEIQFDRILLEMEGDIMSLHHKQIDKSILNEFIKLRNHLLSIKHHLDPNSQYESAEIIIRFIENRKTKIIIDNLLFMIPRLLEKSEVKMSPHPSFSQVKINSLDKLVKFVAILKQAVEDREDLPLT